MTIDSISFAWRETVAPRSTLQQVELIGPQLRLAGWADVGPFPRLSDLITVASDSIQIHDAVVLNRRGMETADRVDRFHVRLRDITLIAQRLIYEVSQPPSPDLVVNKVRREVMLLTPSLRISGAISLYPGADPVAFLQGTDPPFVPLLSPVVRWLADRRLKTVFAFALVNRGHLVAFSTAE